MYVNYFEGRSRIGGSYNRANGYVTWEHNGVIYESEERVDLPADAVEGDSKAIWIDAKTGEYAALQGFFYTLFSGVMNVLISVIILKFLKIKEE